MRWHFIIFRCVSSNTFNESNHIDFLHYLGHQWYHYYHWTVSSPWQRCALWTFRNRLCHINVFVRVWIPQTNDVVGKHKCRYAMDQRICNLEIKQHQAISLTNCFIQFIAMFCIQNYHIYWYIDRNLFGMAT